MICFKSLLLGSSAALLSLALLGQQSSNSQSTSHTGNSSASASSSSSASSNGSRSASAGQQGFGAGSGSASMWAAMPTHVYTLTPSRSVSSDLEQSHRDYLMRLSLANKVLYAGPWRDMPGELVILVTKNDDEAKTIVARDPVVTAGVCTADLRAWKPYLTPARASATPAKAATRGN